MPTTQYNTRKTFAPFIPQVHRGNLTPSVAEKKGPLKVAFTWATRNQVTERGEHGEPIKFNRDNMLGAPQMTFASVDNYLRWHENMAEWQEAVELVDELGFWTEVPDWMLDMADDHRLDNEMDDM